MGRGRSADATEFWRRYDSFGVKDLTLEKATGMPSSTISSCRNGRRYPRAHEAVGMAKAAGTTVEYLVLEEAPNYLPSPERAFYLSARRWRGLIEDLERANPAIVDSLVKAIHASAEESRGTESGVAAEKPLPAEEGS